MVHRLNAVRRPELAEELLERLHAEQVDGSTEVITYDDLTKSAEETHDDRHDAPALCLSECRRRSSVASSAPWKKKVPTRRKQRS